MKLLNIRKENSICCPGSLGVAHLSSYHLLGSGCLFNRHPTDLHVHLKCFSSSCWNNSAVPVYLQEKTDTWPKYVV